MQMLKVEDLFDIDQICSETTAAKQNIFMA
jgi:hypothetical protein